MTKQEYAAYLNSARWQEVRQRYRQSKMPQRCIVCDSPNVQLHHRTYERVGRERLRDLIPLCGEHHQEAHRIRARKQKVKRLATAKQYAYIRRLGGTPAAEMTMRDAKRVIAQLQRQVGWGSYAAREEF